jgi:hypothetical protein
LWFGELEGYGRKIHNKDSKEKLVNVREEVVEVVERIKRLKVER